MLEGPNCTRPRLPQPSRWVPAGAPHRRPWVLAGAALSFSCPPLEGGTGHFAPPQGWVLLRAVLGWVFPVKCPDPAPNPGGFEGIKPDAVSG